MGFRRQPAPHVIDHARGAPAIVTRFIGMRDLAAVKAEQDPFGIAHGCINPAGHQPITSCSEIVCAHCAMIFWR